MAVNRASDPVVWLATDQRQQPYDDIRPQRSGSLWSAPRHYDRLPDLEAMIRHGQYLGWRHVAGNLNAAARLA